MEDKLKKQSLELQEGLEIVELEERLEMVQLSAAEAAGSWKCDSEEQISAGR